MSFRKLMIPIALVAYVVGIPGCSQSKIDGLSGKWQLFNMNNISDPNYYVWDFTDGRLNIYKYPNPPIPGGPDFFVIADADYETKAEFIDAVINISNLMVNGQHQWATPQVSEGEWTSVEIDEEIMRLDTESQGGHVIREFTRVK